MYLIDRFWQLLTCEVVLHFINTWDIKYLLLQKSRFPLSRNFYVRTFVKLTFANKTEAMYERSHVSRNSRTSVNFTFNLNTLYLASLLFTWLKFTCVNVRSQKSTLTSALSHSTWRVPCCNMTSGFAIALAEIRARRILREKGYCKQSSFR